MNTTYRKRDVMLWTAMSAFLFLSLGCLVIDDGEEAPLSEEDEEFVQAPDEPDEPEGHQQQPDPPEREPAPQPRPDEVPSFSIRGAVVSEDASEVPERAQVVVIWQVSTTSPDSLVKYGEGISDGSSFQVDFADEAPITEALNEGALGVAFVLLVPESITLPEDGVLDREAFRMLEGSSLGISSDHAVIFHAPYDGSYRFDWAADFRHGVYNCARGVEASGEERFDSFEQVDCQEVEIKMTPMLSWIDWT